MTDELERRLVCMRCGEGLAGSVGSAGSGRKAGDMQPLACAACDASHAFVAAPKRSDPPTLVYEEGDRVLAEWGGLWWQAEVRAQVDADRWRVHFIGWGPELDDCVERARIRALGRPAATQRSWLLIAAIVVALIGATGVLVLNSGPVDSGGTAVEQGTVLSMGQSVEVEIDGRYHTASILAVNADGTVRVRFSGAVKREDETLARARLRLP